MAQTKHNVNIQFNTKITDLKKAEDLLAKINRQINKIQKGPMAGSDILQLRALRMQYEQVSNVAKNLRLEQEATAKSIMKSTEAQKQFNKEQAKTAAMNKQDGRRVSIGTRTRRALGQSFLEAPLYSASFALMAGIGASIQQFIQLDKTLTRISIVTDRSAESMKNFAKFANDAGKALGVTGQRFAEASLTFLQQGGLAADYANSLAAASIKLANITGTQAADTSEYITAIANSFNVLETDGVRAGARIVDILAAVEAASGASADEIAEAFKKSASSFAAAGFTLEESSAIIATISERTRQAPELIGTGIKTLIGNLSEVKAGSNELSAITNKVQDIADKFGLTIDLVNESTGNLIEIPELLKQIANAYNQIGDQAARRALIEAVAGKEQRDRFIALIESQDRYNELLKIAEYSAGSADAAQSKYLESITGKLEMLRNEWEELVMNVISSDLFKGLIDSTTALLANFNSLIKAGNGFEEVLKRILFVVGAIAISRRLPGAISGIATPSVEGQTTRQAIMGNIGSRLRSNLKSPGNLGTAGLLAAGGLYATSGTRGSEDLLSSEKMTSTIAALAPAVGALLGPMGALLGIVTSLGISLFATNKNLAAARDELSRLDSAAKEIMSTAIGRKEIQDLLDIVTQSDIDKTTERYKEAANRLADLMPGLVNGQDEYGNAILKSNEELREYVSLQKELISIQQAVDMPNIIQGYTDIINEQTRAIDFGLTKTQMIINDIFGWLDYLTAAFNPEYYVALVKSLFGGPAVTPKTFSGRLDQMFGGGLSEDERRAQEIQRKFVTQQRELEFKTYFKNLSTISEDFTESQAIDIQRAFDKILSEDFTTKDPAIVEFKNKYNSIINDLNRGVISAESAQVAISDLFNENANTLSRYGKRLADFQTDLNNYFADPKNALKSKEVIRDELTKRYGLTEEDFQEMGGDSYYDFVKNTIEDVRYFTTKASQELKFKEILTEIFGVSPQDEYIKTILNGADDLSQAYEYLAVVLRKDIAKIRTLIANAQATGGGITEQEFIDLQAQIKSLVGSQATLQAKRLTIPSLGMDYLSKKYPGIEKGIITGVELKLNEVEIDKQTDAFSKRTTDIIEDEFENLLKKILDKYILLFSNLRVQQERNNQLLEYAAQYSDEWRVAQAEKIKLTEREVALTKAQNAELADLYSKLPKGQEFDQKRQEIQLKINDGKIAQIQLDKAIRKDQDILFNSKFLEKINAVNEKIQDQNDLMSTLDKSSKDFLGLSKALIDSNIELYESKMSLIAALSKEKELSEDQKKILADTSDEVLLLADSIKKMGTDLALNTFYKAMYGEVDIDALKERYEINLQYYDDLINAQEEIIEKSRLQLEIQQEIESSTDATYKANLKYLETKLKDTKLTNQQINAIRAQIGLLKSLSAAAGPGEAQQFRLTRTRTGAYRFAPTGTTGSTAEKKAAALEAATTFEQQAVDQYRKIADQIFSAETQAALLTSQGRTGEAATLTQLAGSLRGQLGAQASEVERAKVVSALVQQGQIGLASKVSIGQVSAQQAMAGMSPQQRAAIQESISQSKISVLSPEVTSTEKLIFTNEQLIKALNDLRATMASIGSKVNISESQIGKGVATPGSAVESENERRLREEPGFLESEIARANSVIRYRKSMGLDTSAQEAYLNRLLTMSPVSSKNSGANSSYIPGVSTSYPIPGMESGGYTGNSSGLAILHDKELVLNKMDTENMLKAVGLVRQMPQLRGMIPNIPDRAVSTPGQNIVINADFPGVSSADEIRKAFASMSNMALQYAYKTKSY